MKRQRSGYFLYFIILFLSIFFINTYRVSGQGTVYAHYSIPPSYPGNAYSACYKEFQVVLDINNLSLNGTSNCYLYFECPQGASINSFSSTTSLSGINYFPDPFIPGGTSFMLQIDSTPFTGQITFNVSVTGCEASYPFHIIFACNTLLAGGGCPCGSVTTSNPCTSQVAPDNSEAYLCVPVDQPRVVFDYTNLNPAYPAIPTANNGQYFLKYDEVYRYYKILPAQGITDYFTLDIVPEQDIEILSVEAVNINNPTGSPIFPQLYSGHLTTPLRILFNNGTGGFNISTYNSNTSHPLFPYLKAGTSDCIVIREKIRILKTSLCDVFNENQGSTYHLAVRCDHTLTQPECSFDDMTLNVLSQEAVPNLYVDIKDDFDYTPRFACCQYTPQDVPYFVNYSAEIQNKAVITGASTSGQNLAVGSGTVEITQISMEINSDYFDFDDSGADGVKINGHNVGYTSVLNTSFPPRKIITITTTDLQAFCHNTPPPLISSTSLQSTLNGHNGYNQSNFPFSPSTFLFLPEGDSFKVTLKDLHFTGCNRAGAPQVPFSLTSNGSPAFYIQYNQMCQFNEPPSISGATDDHIQNDWIVSSDFLGDASITANPPQIFPANPVSHITAGFDVTSDDVQPPPHPTVSQPWDLYQINDPVTKIMSCPNIHYRAIVHMSPGYSILGNVTVTNSTGSAVVTATHLGTGTNDWAISNWSALGLANPASVILDFNVHSNCTSGSHFDRVSIDFQANCDNDHCNSCYLTYGSAAVPLFNDCGGACVSPISTESNPDNPQSFHFLRTTFGWATENDYESGNAPVLASAVSDSDKSKFYEYDVLHASCHGVTDPLPLNAILNFDIGYAPPGVAPYTLNSNIFDFIGGTATNLNAGAFHIEPLSGTFPPFDVPVSASNSNFILPVSSPSPPPYDPTHWLPTVRIKADMNSVITGVPNPNGFTLADVITQYPCSITFNGDFRVQDHNSPPLAATGNYQNILTVAEFSYTPALAPALVPLVFSCDPSVRLVSFFKLNPVIEDDFGLRDMNGLFGPGWRRQFFGFWSTPDECSMRYLLYTRVESSTSGDNFPSEYRPVLDWPDKMSFEVPTGVFVITPAAIKAGFIGSSGGMPQFSYNIPSSNISITAGSTPGTEKINLNGLHLIPGYRSIDRIGLSRQGFALQLTRACMAPGQPSDAHITIDNVLTGPANAGLLIKEHAYDATIPLPQHSDFTVCPGATTPACSNQFTYSAVAAHETFNMTASIAPFVSSIPATTNPITIPISFTSMGSSGSSLPNMWVYFTTSNVSSPPVLSGTNVSSIVNGTNTLWTLGTGGFDDLTVNFNCVPAANGIYAPVVIHVHYGNSCDGYHQLYSSTGDPAADFTPPMEVPYFPCYHNSFDITIIPQESELRMSTVDVEIGCDDIKFSFDVSSNASGEITNAIIQDYVPSGFVINPFSSSVQITSQGNNSIYTFSSLQTATINPLNIDGPAGVLPYIDSQENTNITFSIGTTLHYELHYFPDCLPTDDYLFSFEAQGNTPCSAVTTTRQVTVNYTSCRSCCTLYPNSLSPIDFSTNGFIASGNRNLNHSVTVTNSFTFDAADVAIADGVSITVAPDAVLTIQNNSNLHGCTHMWQGIVVQPGGRLVVTNNGTNTANGISTIADAEYGAHVFGDGEVRVEDSYFRDNIIGLQTDQTLNGTSTPYVYVERSVFAGTGSFLSNFSSQTILPETYPRAGMILNNVSGVTIGGNSVGTPNVFHHLNEGIGTYKTNITILNTKFHDIGFADTYLAVNPSGLATGIFSGGPAGYVLTQTGFGKYAADASFENCKTGITAYQSSAYLSENYMTGMGIGIKVGQDGSSHGKKVQIHDNRIEATRFGIWGWNNNFPRIFDISNNEIVFGHQFSFSGCGISMNDNYGKGVKTISSNTITFNGTGGYGIRVNSGANYHITYNDVVLTDEVLNKGGIQINDNDSTELSCNHVYTTYSTSSYSLADQAGISVNKSKYSLIACNEVQNTTNGIFFGQDCPNTDFKGNSIGTSDRGLSFDYFGVIDHQDYKGNIWFGTYLYGAYHPDQLTGLNSKFKVDANCNPLLVPPITSLIYNVVFNLQMNGCVNFECTPAHEAPLHYYCSEDILNERFSNSSDSLDKRIAQGSIHFNEYDDEMKWSMEKFLFEKLADNPGMRDTDTLLAVFYNDRVGTVVEGFKNINDAGNDLYQMETVVRNVIDNYQDQIQQSIILISFKNRQIENGGLTSLQIDQLKSEITALKSGIENAQAYIDEAIHQLNENKLFDAEIVRQLNLGLTTSETIESNQKEVNEIFLNSIAKGEFEFTSTQINELYNIAVQCPVSGGRAVYQARSMYSMIDPSIEYDDKLACLQGGIVLRHKKSENKTLFHTYPNPTSDEATLTYTINSDCLLEVYNSFGQRETIYKLNCKLHEFSFSTSQFSNGVYILKINVNDRNEEILKLVVTH